jgi:uncharacterized protein (TIGR03435 family)
MRLILLAGLLASTNGTLAQLPAQTDPHPAFEAASVKPNSSGSGSSSWHSRPANIDMKNVTLRTVIMAAYKLKDYQISGPASLQTEHYDIVAKAPFGTPDEQLELMLQTLLAERFKLEAHRETKDFPVYGLVQAKGGIKLKEVEAGGAGMNSNGNESGGELKAQKATMAGLAVWLSRQMDRPVVDMTGISGAYDFILKYSREDAKGESTTATYPIVSLAIQEQLGVRLEKRTAAIEVMVIDHAEKVPVGN